MNQNRKRIIIPEYWAERCLCFGEQLVEHYATGGSRASRAVSGQWGAERDPIKQAQGKLGECAMALLLGVKPAIAVKWNLRPDKGGDLRMTGGTRLDVKTTYAHHKRLIWSKEINHLYAEKQFDALVSVSYEQGGFNFGTAVECWIEGFLSKQQFFERKQTTTNVPGLHPDTWFVFKDELRSVDELLHDDQARALRDGRFEHYCQCGKWGSFGVGVRPLDSGRWFCAEHRPNVDAARATPER